MRDHDLELIAALVEGGLEDETEARALIESSPEARAEYEVQLRAHSALIGLGPVKMTEPERSALHRDVWTALRSAPTVTPPTTTPWYARWAPAAAVVALVVVGLVGILGGGEDAANLLEIAADLDERSTSTAAASGEATAGGEAGGDDMAPLDAPTSTAGATSSDGGGVSPEAMQFFSAEAERVRATDGPSNTTGDDSTEQTDLESCLRDAGLVDHVVADTVEPEEIDGSQAEQVIIAVPEGVEVEEATVTFVDSVTCEVVYTDE